MNLNKIFEKSEFINSNGSLKPNRKQINLIKTSQVEAPQPSGSFAQGLENTLGLTGRAIERGMMGYTSVDYIPQSHGEINAYADWAKNQQNTTTDPKLKNVFGKLYDQLVSAKRSIVALAQRQNADYRYTEPALAALGGRGQDPRQRALQIDPELAGTLSSIDYPRAQQSFYTWVGQQENIYNDPLYNSYLGIIKSAAVLMKAITDPSLAAGISSGTVRAVPAAGAGAIGGGVSTTTPSGRPGTTPGAKPKISVNEALVNAVFRQVKKSDPSKSDTDIYQSLSYDTKLAGYYEIGKNPELRSKIEDHIRSLSYSQPFKDRMIKRLGEKIARANQIYTGTEPGTTTTSTDRETRTETTPPTSPFPSEQAPTFLFLENMLREFEAKDKTDRNFILSWPRDYAKFLRLLKNAYEAHTITPTQYDYLKGAITSIEYEYRAIISRE